MYQKKFWKRALTLLAAAGCALSVAATASADIGTVQWQKTFNTSYTSFYFGAFEAVDFLDSTTILASGHGDGALAVRYDAATGTVLDNPPEWIRYDTGNDYFYDLAIDTNGDIYFAGRKDPYDPGVWKYDSTGTLQTGWPKVYAAAGDGRNTGAALDSAGFVYAVGYNNDDWLISKYDKNTGVSATGFPITYNPNGFSDKASKVAVDSNDNFIVAGWVGTSATSYDWHVQKYASDGTLLWETSYDLKGNTEAAIDVGIDSEDNIIVCGYRNNGTDESTGMDRDWYIVKYAKNGDGSGGATVLWEQAWNSGNGATSRVARTLLIDSSDNFYVAGDEYDSSGAARPLIQYRDGQTGALIKSQELPHPVTVRGAAGTAGTELDYISDLALLGNQLVIAGYVWEGYLNYGRTGFLIMLELTPAVGVEKWNSSYSSPESHYGAQFLGVGFQNDDTILVGGTEHIVAPGNAGIGIRYDTDTGVPLDTPAEWIKEVDAGYDMRFYGQDIGSDGSIYACGPYSTGGGYAYGVWKYSSTGVKQWSTRETNYGNLWEVMAVGTDYVYTVGYINNSNRNWVIHKYNTSDGTSVTGFPITYDHNGLDDVALSIAQDSTGNIIVLGYVTQSADNYNIMVRKYDSSGSLLWESQYDHNGLNDISTGVTVDSDDNILVTGNINNGTDNSTGADFDWFMAKYAKDGDGTGNGELLWQQSWDDGNLRDGIARSLVTDKRNNFFVLGMQKNSTGFYRPYIQYRDGKTGTLLKSQELSHTVTHNNLPDKEHDYVQQITLNDTQLAITMYTQEDPAPTDYARVGRLALVSISKTYNVTTGSTDSDCSDGECNLQAALSEAENNVGINTVLRLQQGTYTGNFVYAPATGNNGDLTILGGYSADFTTRTLDPTNTILDGNNTGPVLQLNPDIPDGTTTVNGSLMVEGVTLRNGSSPAPGGGLLALTNSPGTIEVTGNIIENNQADDTGGGCAAAVFDFATPVGGDIYFSDNIVRNNTVLLAGATDGNGGGCSFMVTGEAIFTNNLVYGNTVGDVDTYITTNGGGLDFDLLAGELILTNNTIVDNKVLRAGANAIAGGIFLGTSSFAWAPTAVTLYNNIISNNDVSYRSYSYYEDIYNQMVDAGSTAGSSLRIVYNYYSRFTQSTAADTVWPSTALNKVGTNPVFSSNADSLYKLISGSPCIDTGSNDALDMPGIDLAGASRPQDNDGDGTATANMGCYEEIVYSIEGVANKGGSLDASTPSPQIVYAGDTVTFTFNSDADLHIDTVSGCGVNYTNTDNSVTSYTATTDAVTDNCTVTADFAINQYQVTATAGADGELDASTPSPQTVDHGSTTQFKFNANTNYHVASISGCGISYTNTDNNIGAYTARTDAVTNDCQVSATFAINQYQVTASAGANGELDGSTPSPQTVDHGSTTQFKFNADAGFHVASITGCGISYTNTDNSITTYTATTDAVTGVCAVNATFAPHYIVTASAGAGGLLDASTPSPQTVNENDTTSFTFNADAGYHVASITGCGITYSNTSNSVTTYTATTDPVTADCTVSATFAINRYQVTATAVGSGTLDSSTPSPVEVNHNATPNFIFNPKSGYHMDQVTGTCGGSLSGTTFTTNPVTSDCTVIASFTDQYTLSLVFEGKGTGTVTSEPQGIDCPTNCSADYQDGTDVTLTAVADKKSTFMGWTGDVAGACAGTDPCTVTMDQAREITATFKSGFPWTMFLPAITRGNQ